MNLFLAVRLYLNFPQTSAPVIMQILKGNTPRFAGALDIDNDGEDEVVYSHYWEHPNLLPFSILEHRKSGYEHHHYADILVSTQFEFFTATYKRDRITTSIKGLYFDEGKLYLRVYDQFQEHNRLVTFPVPELTGLNHETWFVKPRLADLDLDGFPELLIVFQPRDNNGIGVLACYNPQTGKKRWEFPCASPIHGLDIIDTGTTRQKERHIVISTFATNKGLRHNDIKDENSYVIVLNHQGQLTWKQETGGWQTRALITTVDLENDGKLEIIAARQTGKKPREPGGKIYCFDAATGDIRKIRVFPNVSLSNPVALAHETTGYRIYTGDSKGVLRVMDNGLNLLDTINISQAESIRVLDTSASGRPWKHLLVITPSSMLVCTKESPVQILHRFLFTKGEMQDERDRELLLPYFIPLRHHSHLHGLVVTDVLYLVKESGSPVKDGLIPEAFYPFIVSLAVLLLFNIIMAVVLYRLHKGRWPLSRRGDLKISQLQNVIQDTAHRINEPITGILWTTEKIKSGLTAIDDPDKRQKYGQLTEFLEDDVQLLRKKTHNIMRLIQLQRPQFCKTNLKSLLTRLLDQQVAVSGENASISTHLELEEDIIVMADEKLLKEALVILIDNAVEAMPGGGKLTLSAVPVIAPEGNIKEVIIEVEDSGMGMDEEIKEKAFKPFFTSKEKGTGIGLNLCKRILDLHAGHIDIYSRKNFGTKIAITLPCKSN